MHESIDTFTHLGEFGQACLLFFFPSLASFAVNELPDLG